MSANVPLSVISSTYNQSYYATMAIGNNVIVQQPSGGYGGYYWFVVINRKTLNVEFNQVQTQANVVPNLGALNSPDHILIVATLGVGLNNAPQGALYKFLDENGGGMELRRIDQIAQQFNCGYLGTFGYCLCCVLGNLNIPGFEVSALGQVSGPILTIQLLPSNSGYTPIQISNA
ncbi:MAG: hypothetical protein JSS49_24495 [Planctomycetes bacterium]|nr:hypothetical protein [Planctomycetota bacterium]